MKDYRKIVHVLIAVAAVNLIITLCMIPGLPELVPVHFNHKMEVDQMGSPWILALFPAIPLVFSIAMATEQRFRGKEYANNKVLSFFAVGFVVFFIALGWVFYAVGSSAKQMGEGTDVPLMLILGLGLSALFILIGNYTPTLQPNRTIGIRMRATLSDPEVWRRAHRFAGKYFVFGGMFSAAMTLIGYFTGLEWLAAVGLLCAVIGPMVIVLIHLRKITKR